MAPVVLTGMPDPKQVSVQANLAQARLSEAMPSGRSQNVIEAKKA